MGESAIVLCGGRSQRMGRDKAFLDFGGEPLLARVVRRVREVADDVVLVAREGQELPGGFEAVRDPAEGLGPLAGIAVGLGAVRGERALVVACDMPLLQAGLARRLYELSQGVEACVPVVGGYPVPTCAVYTRSAAARAQELLARRELRPRAFFERVKTRYVAESELREVDPELASFLDCDDEASYRKALAAAGLG